MEPNIQTSPIWSPTLEQIRAANITRFTEGVVAKYNLRNSDFQTLWEWSVAAPEEFWSEVWAFTNVRSSRPWTDVLRNGEKIPGASWFVGAELNFAENLLRRRDDSEALIFWSETRARRALTFNGLYDLVSNLQQYLLNTGLKQGDRVAALMPNTPEAVAAMLATASIGAIWSSSSPDFGAQGILDRFSQIEPQVLFAAEGYYYNGKYIDIAARIPELVAQIPSIRSVVLIPYLGVDGESVSQTAIPNAVTLKELQTSYKPQAIQFTQLPFSHPLYIMYSSGTTGKPKCIVHSAGGTLLQHLKELVLHTDLKRDERIFYFTTCGWMMWNWVISSLAVEASVVLFDGSPFHPTPDILFEMAEREGVNVFGTSAKYLLTAEKLDVAPKKHYRLNRLRSILSTGSPLPPTSFDYVYREIKSDLCLSSISGGTDIVSCFVLGNPALPVHRGEIQCRGLGMKVEVFDDRGRSVSDDKGELVCTAPFPSMPIYFWNDPEGKKFHDSYFNVYPNVWRHGDWVELTPHGGIVIYGRSDAVLNPGGVRIGTAEIYRQVEALPEVAESLVTGQSWENDERIVLFVKLQPGVVLDETLGNKIRTTIRANLTPRHVPSKIIAVPDIPKTLNGKISELAVKNILHNRPVKNAEALANPGALEYFHNIEELAR